MTMAIELSVDILAVITSAVAVIGAFATLLVRTNLHKQQLDEIDRHLRRIDDHLAAIRERLSRVEALYNRFNGAPWIQEKPKPDQ